MARGAAKESSLGKLHLKLTELFIKVLQRYEDRMAVGARIDAGEIDLEADMIDELFNDNVMPNPAMLGAISKFLKDNEISFDTEQLEELGSLERRLAEQRKKRDNVTTLANLPRAVSG
jgi:hypothetical protein